jgi:hypothetical protein
MHKLICTSSARYGENLFIAHAQCTDGYTYVCTINRKPGCSDAPQYAYFKSGDRSHFWTCGRQSLPVVVRDFFDEYCEGIAR